MRREKTYIFTEEKMKKVFELLKERNLLEEETFITIPDEEITEYENDELYEIDGIEDSGEYKVTMKGLCINYINHEACGTSGDIDEVEQYFLTEKGVLHLQYPGYSYGEGDANNFYNRGFVSMYQLEKTTSISGILNWLSDRTSHIIPENILDEMENILKT